MIKIGLTDFTPASKIIDIRDKNQVIKAQKAIGNADVLKCTLMSEHYIELSFDLNVNTLFKRSDYIEWEGDKYTLRADYQPERVSKRQYKYTLVFEAVEMFFQDVQYYYLNQGIKESEWRLVGNPEYFIKMAVDNINRYFGVTDFNVGTIEPTETKDILFNTNTNTFDALTQIAEEYNAEWYVTGKTIHLLNKVSFGSEVSFETEASVASIKRNDGDAGTSYTRIVALGSTRNIPNDYRAVTAGEGVDAIYPQRLRIPIAKGDVIDAYPDMSPDEVVEGTVIFDDIYPKRVGTMEAVGTIEYTDTNEDTGEKTKWNAYTFKDSGIDFKEEYVLPGEELRLVFQSGDLNGMDFALIFHDNGFSGSDNSQYFELVRNEDYGKALPNDTVKPKVSDKYVLYGFDISLVSNQYVPVAELELYNTASEWLQNQLKDTSVYECPTVIQYFHDNQMDLAIGQNVTLVAVPFDTDSRSSRIMGFEKKLNNKYDATYTVGDNSAYSRLAGIEKDIQELQYAGIVYENTGGNSVYVIKQFDTTRPSDFNVYSAQASNAKYFNKQAGDTVQGDALFMRNLQVQGLAISNVFQNSTFTAGQLGSGFQVKRDANGQSYMEVDNLLVRREAVFNRLTIAEIRSVGGTILLSLASMLLLEASDAGSTWKCFFDTGDGTIPNDFAIGDMAICRKYTGQDVKYYWALVTAVGADYIELSKTDKDGSGVPDVGDEVVQLGNRTDANRQHAIMLSAYGSDAPSIKQYSGINSYDLTGKEVTAISPAGNKFTGAFTVATNGTTAPVYKERGAFVNSTVYYLNDRVSYLGSLWVCIVSSTITTPSETSSTWRKETTGQADIDELRSEYQADFIVLDTKIASKVSQTDFDALGNRVSNTESSITQLSGSITSLVEKVDNLELDAGNRTYYQDEVPDVPSGGHKAGDLWYKVSLVDASGNINVNTSKNIFQLQYRWSGTIWQQINWSVSKSKIEQTDSSISLIVEKTGIDSVGAGSSLYSMINQTAEQISIEVNKIQVGGRNYLRQGNYAVSNYITNTIVLPPGDYIATCYNCLFDNIGIAGEGYTYSNKFTLSEYKLVTLYALWGSYPAIPLDQLHCKIEKGNKATDWSPAPEDIPEIAGSALTITSNKISLASKTIELKGSTIADAITIGGDLKVGSRAGTSALEVLQSGTFYAKGSVGSDSSLIIDSGTQSIEITSPYSASGVDDGGSTPLGKSTVRISSQSGGVEVRDSSYNMAIMSPNGVAANKAGQAVASATSGIDGKAAIVGLGSGNVASNFNDTNFIAGVYGAAANSGTAQAFGGYFETLRANGFVMGMRSIVENTGNTDQYTTLNRAISFVVSNSVAMQTVYLPTNAYAGTVIWFKQWWTGYMRIRPQGIQELYDDSTRNDYLDVGQGQTAMLVFIGNWLNKQTGVNRGIWMFSKFMY